MLSRALHTCFVFFCLSLTLNGFAQNNKSKPAYQIFEDLPIDDPALNSVLATNENPEEKIRSNIFIRPQVNKQKCFVGEPVMVTYELYSALQSTSEILLRPRLAGFHTAPMEISNEEVRYKTVDGRKFRVFTLLKFQANPYQDGKLSIDPITVQNEVKYESTEGRKKQYEGTVISRSLDIVVEPLPLKDKPAGYSGAVGVFTLTASLQDTNITAGQGNVLRIVIEGSGNFSAVAQPEIQWPEGFEPFPAKELSEIDNNAFPAMGKKIFEIPFVPKKAGDFNLPAVRFSYFNASGRSYETLASLSLRLIVDGNTITPGNNVVKTPAPKQSIPWLYWLAAGIAILSISAFIFFARRNTKAKQKAVEARFAAAAEAVEQEPVKDIAWAKAELHRLALIETTAEYIVAYKSLLKDFLQEKIESNTLSDEQLVDRLIQHDVVTGANVQALLKECNLLLYAPGFIDSNTRNLLEDKFIAVIEFADPQIPIISNDRV